MQSFQDSLFSQYLFPPTSPYLSLLKSTSKTPKSNFRMLWGVILRAFFSLFLSRMSHPSVIHSSLYSFLNVSECQCPYPRLRLLFSSLSLLLIPILTQYFSCSLVLFLTHKLPEMLSNCSEIFNSFFFFLSSFHSRKAIQKT